MSGHVGTIFRKELIESLRDKRTLLAMIVLPTVLYPLMAVVFGQAASTQADKLERRTLRVAVVGGTEPRLEQYLRSKRLRLTTTSDPARDIRSGRLDAVVELGSPALPRNVKIRYNAGREDSLQARNRVYEATNEWSWALVRQTLRTHGLPVQHATPLRTQDENLAPPRKVGGFALGRLLPFIIVVMGMLGAFYPAIDLAAGEKERGTMETLLVTPVPRVDIVLGKYLCVTVLAFITVTMNVVSIAFTAVHSARLAGGSGTHLLRFAPSATALAQVFMVTIPLLALFASLMLLVAAFARSFKEAQNYLTPVFTVVMMPSFITVLPGVKLTPQLALAPVAGPCLLIRDLFAGEAAPAQIALVMAASLVYAGLLLWLTTILFQREDLLLSESEGVSLGNWWAEWRQSGVIPPSVGGAFFFVVAQFLLFFYVGAAAQAREVHSGLAFSQLVLLLGGSLCFLRFMHWEAGAALRLRAPKLRAVAGAVLCGLGGSVLVAELAAVQNRVMPAPKALLDAMQDLLTATSPGGLALTIFVFAVLPGICEEVAFRGVVQTALERSWGGTRAAAVTALMFGAFHLNLYRLLPTTTLGLLLGLLAVRTHSIVPCIVAHATINSTAVLLVNVKSPFLSQLESAAHLPVPWLVCGASVLAAGWWLTGGGRADPR